MDFKNTGTIKKTTQNERITTTTTKTYSITTSTQRTYSTSDIRIKPCENLSNEIKNELSTVGKTSLSTLNDSLTATNRPDFKSSYSMTRISPLSYSKSEDKQFQKLFEDSSSKEEYKNSFKIEGTSNPFATEFNNEYKSPYSGNVFKKVSPSQTKLLNSPNTETNERTVSSPHSGIVFNKVPSSQIRLIYSPNTKTNDRTVYKTNENNKLEQRFPEQNSQPKITFLRQPFFNTSKTSTNKNSMGKPGICYIFNHENFDSSEQDYRLGTQHDVALLRKTFQSFKVNVKVFKDLTVKGIQIEINKIEQKDFKNYSCIVIAILSHGNRRETIKAKDGLYSIDDHVLFPLLRNKTLAKKPKILIIQACKGNMFAIDSAQSVIPASGNPTEIIKCYSTFEGYVSFRGVNGSIFIKTFCDLFQKFGNSTDIKKIMEMVIRDVQNVTNGSQIPSIYTTMTEPYIFGHYI